jgi:hypothetical protein
LDSALSLSLPVKHTSPGKIEFIIKKLHNKKALNYDSQIKNLTTKNLSNKIIILLFYTYNAMLRLSYYLLTWKFSEIILIPKPTSLQENYLISSHKLITNSIKYIQKYFTKKVHSFGYEGLLFKLKKFLPSPYYLLIKSYLSDRTFIVRENSSNSNYFDILAGVPQSSNIVSFLYNIFTHDILKTSYTELGSYTDDMTIIASN